MMISWERRAGKALENQPWAGACIRYLGVVHGQGMPRPPPSLPRWSQWFCTTSHPLLRKPPAGLAPVEAVILHYEPPGMEPNSEESSLHRDELGGGGTVRCRGVVQNHRSTGASPAGAGTAQLTDAPWAGGLERPNQA